MGQFKIQEDMIKCAFIKIESKITSKSYFPQRLVLISISLSLFSEHKNLTAILRIRSAIKILIVSVIDFLTML